ncbi:MAG: transposase [Alishewanella sp. 34-51-39]|nr:MAG: transposase [Alishewanella sp. 34-51-39]
MRREKAVYSDAILPEHRGNPLIEALSPKKTIQEMMESFANYPDLSEEIRNHPDPLVREEYTSRLRELRQPLPIYFDVFRAIERALKNGYSAKNPFSPTTLQYLHYQVDERPAIEPKTGFFEPKGEGITLIGESGVGKSSMLDQILNYFPTVIEHGNYKGKPVGVKNQVVWIKVDCPNNSSVRELCEEILTQLDIATNSEKTRSASTVGGVIRQIEQRIKSCFLGILVIDEMQRLVFKRTGGENNLLNFLHSLVNKLGVPIFFCANPPFDETLARTLKAARRAESAGSFTMESLKRDSNAWNAFIEELWELQWTNVYNELTDELNDKLYELSVGNLDLAHRIYRDAQRTVIGSGDERITTAVLEYAYTTACNLSANTNEIIEKRSQDIIPRRQKVAQTEGAESVTIKKLLVSKSIIPDITRPQHPEFEPLLREIQLSVNLQENIEDPNLIRRVLETDHPLEYLRAKGILCDDPISIFD